MNWKWYTRMVFVWCEVILKLSVGIFVIEMTSSYGVGVLVEWVLFIGTVSWVIGSVDKAIHLIKYGKVLNKEERGVYRKA